MKKMKSMGYAIGLAGLLFQALDQIETEYHEDLDESAKLHAQALEKIDSDTYGLYRMLKFGFSAPSDAAGAVEREKELTRIYKIYENRYDENSKEGIRKARELSALSHGERVKSALKAVFTIGYSLIFLGACIIGFCDYREAKNKD